MIELVTGNNAALFKRELEEMFRLRYELYVKRRGWSALDRGDGREIDQFDNDDAVYLLGTEGERGSVIAGTRLMPTVGPHLMANVFPHIAARGVPRAPNILEMTRYFVDPKAGRGARARRLGGEVLCAMFEYAIARDINYITVVCDTFFLPQMRVCGWVYETLGPPYDYGEGRCIAVKFEASERVLASTRKARGIEGPCLRVRDPGGTPVLPAPAPDFSRVAQHAA